MGGVNVGKRTLLKAVADELAKKDDDVLVTSVLQVKAHHLRHRQGGDFETAPESLLSRDTFDRVEATLRYTTLIRSGGEAFAVPLDVTSFLAGKSGRTVVLLAPPSVYPPLVKALRYIRVRVMHVVCAPHVIEERLKKNEIGRLAMAALRTPKRQDSVHSASVLARISSGASPMAVAGARSGIQRMQLASAGCAVSPVNATANTRRRSSTAVVTGKTTPRGTLASNRPPSRASRRDDAQGAFDLGAAGVPHDVIETIDNNKSIGHSIAAVLEVLGYG